VLAFGLSHRAVPLLQCGPAEEQLMCGVVTAIYANRFTPDGELRELGVPQATNVAFRALAALHLSHPIDTATVQHIR